MMAGLTAGFFRFFRYFFQNSDIMKTPLPFQPNTESKRFGFSSVSGKQSPAQRLHRHDEIELGILEHGSVDAIIGRNRLLFPPNRLVVFWASQPHGPLKVTPGTLAHVVHVPLPFVKEAGLPPAFLRRMLEGEVFIAAEGADQRAMVQAVNGALECRCVLLDMERARMELEDLRSRQLR